MSLLLLEDEVLVAMALKDDLEDAGAAQVDVARTEAMARGFKDNGYDVAILDVSVPDGTSFALAKELLGQGTGVVFHSGHADGEATADMPNSVFCMKPATADQVISCILEARSKMSTT